jgi:uncharacterized membrane protein YoaK (UPF0700 family)
MALRSSTIVIPVLSAVVAGFADSDDYLRWHQFAANMTGNTVLLGIAAVGGSLHAALTAAAPIGAFLVGCALAQAASRRSPALLLAGEAALLAGVSFMDGSRVQLAVVAVAMGLQNVVVQSLDPIGANTSFITGNYSRIAQAAVAVLSGKGDATLRRTLAVMLPLVASYAVGAAVAAALVTSRTPHSLLATVPVLAVLAVAVRRRRAPGLT